MEFYEGVLYLYIMLGIFMTMIGFMVDDEIKFSSIGVKVIFIILMVLFWIPMIIIGLMTKLNKTNL